MAAYTSMTRILSRLHHTKQLIIQWLYQNQPPGMYGALVSDATLCPDSHLTTPTHKSLLETIFDSIVWAAVPKKRRSLEKRLTRKHGCTKHFEAAVPKKNIVACLDCGHWHERHTICGNCYKKVWRETLELKQAMGDDFKYATPQTEVAVMYEDEKEEPKMYKGKYIIERNKPRPSWFPRQLTTRAQDDS